MTHGFQFVPLVRAFTGAHTIEPRFVEPDFQESMFHSHRTVESKASKHRPPVGVQFTYLDSDPPSLTSADKKKKKQQKPIRTDARGRIRREAISSRDRTLEWRTRSFRGSGRTGPGPRSL